MCAERLRIAPATLEGTVITPILEDAKALPPYSWFKTYGDMRSYIVREFGLKVRDPYSYSIERVFNGKFCYVNADSVFDGPKSVRLSYKDSKGYLDAVFVLAY